MSRLVPLIACLVVTEATTAVDVYEWTYRNARVTNVDGRPTAREIVERYLIGDIRATVEHTGGRIAVSFEPLRFAAITWSVCTTLDKPPAAMRTWSCR